MNILFIPFVLLFSLLFCSNITATTYYLDFTNGANNQDGLTPSTAWKDLFKIRALNGATGPLPGDKILFKRGETWNIPFFIINDNGTAENPIVYGAYGNSNDDLPILSSVVALTDATLTINWMATSNPNIWTLNLSSSPGRLFIDGQEVLRASTLADVGQVDNEGATGRWFYDEVQDELHLSAPQNPADEYSLFEGSTSFYTFLADANTHVIFENLDLRGGTGAALWINASSDILVQNCKLGHSGNSGLLISDSNANLPSSNVTVKNNTFDSDFTFFYGLGSERGCGDGVRLTGGASNCEVFENTFKNWAHNAIELLANNASDAGVNNNRFYDNQISAPDIPYSRAFGADGFLGKCQENEFFRNNVRDVRTNIQVNGNNNWVHHNIIRGMRTSPSRTNAVAFAFSLGVYGPGLVCENNRYDHNLIMDTDEAAFNIRGFGFTNQVQNNLIRNNVMINTGLAPLNNAYNPGTAIYLFDTNTDGLGPNTYQNNLFYNTQSLTSTVFIDDTDTYLSIEEFNNQNGVDGNTISDNLDENPQLTDLVNADYFPLSNSPLIDAGVNTSLTIDYAKNDRLRSLAPDIGPFETPFRSIFAEPLPIGQPKTWLLFAFVIMFLALGLSRRV